MTRPRKHSRRRQDSASDDDDDDDEIVEAQSSGGSVETGASRRSAEANNKMGSISSAAAKQAAVVDLTSDDGGGGAMDVAEASSSAAVKDVEADDADPENEKKIESAAFGSEPAQLDERDSDSNLADVEPEVGMEIDFRDPDYIWSSAKIVKVSKGRGRPQKGSASSGGSPKGRKLQVTVRYDGWPSDWDEVVSWPCVRVARLFTYTKRVKCLVDGLLLMKKKPQVDKKIGEDGKRIIYCTYWPCNVRFRMPHPAHKERAAELLRLEPNLSVQPYAQDHLPQALGCTIANGGCWLHNNKLRMWKDPDALDVLGVLPPNFDVAHKAAMQDTSTPGKLPIKAFEIGSLLNEDYRVFTLGGEPVKGQWFTGATPDYPKPSITTTTSKSASKTDRKMKLRSEEEARANESKRQLRHRIELPPSLPTPIAITESSRSSSEAVRFHKTQRWGAALSIGGNDLFLGSFPSQVHASASSELALAPDAETATSADDCFPKNEEEGRLADLNSVKLEDSICALEKSGMMQSQDRSFSLHEWTMQNILYHAYLKEKRKKRLSGAEDNRDDGKQVQNDECTKKRSLQVSAESKPKRKQSKPRHLDLMKRVYVD